MNNPRRHFFYLGRVRSAHEGDRVAGLRKLRETIANLPAEGSSSLAAGKRLPRFSQPQSAGILSGGVESRHDRPAAGHEPGKAEESADAARYVALTKSGSSAPPTQFFKGVVTLLALICAGQMAAAVIEVREVDVATTEKETTPLVELERPKNLLELDRPLYRAGEVVRFVGAPETIAIVKDSWFDGCEWRYRLLSARYEVAAQ